MNYLVLIVQDRIVYITELTPTMLVQVAKQESNLFICYVETDDLLTAGHKAMDFYKNRGTNDTLCDNVQ